MNNEFEKDVGVSDHDLIQCKSWYFGISWGSEENHEQPQAKIRTRHFPNRNKKRYGLNQLVLSSWNQIEV
jgi:hypothetical protein